MVLNASLWSLEEGQLYTTLAELEVLGFTSD